MGLVFSLLLLLTVGVFSSGGNTCKGKVGFLVLAHGGNRTWNSMVLQALEPLRREHPVEVAFGMADPTSIKTGIENL
ncbi:MAG: hypothetical protein Q9N34_03485, partial [Aquificota bacterium]|nr:hypothetical protein [Aquificota bacterium]